MEGKRNKKRKKFRKEEGIQGERRKEKKKSSAGFKQVRLLLDSCLRVLREIKRNSYLGSSIDKAFIPLASFKIFLYPFFLLFFPSILYLFYSFLRPSFIYSFVLIVIKIPSYVASDLSLFLLPSFHSFSIPFFPPSLILPPLFFFPQVRQ